MYLVVVAVVVGMSWLLDTGTTSGADMIPSSWDGGTLVGAVSPVITNPFVAGSFLALVGFALAFKFVWPKLRRAFGH